jgi:alpha-L-rhamnosidase
VDGYLLTPRIVAPQGFLTQPGGRARLATSWKIEGESFALDVTVPPNTSAEVTLWGARVEDVREGGQPLQGVPGVRQVRQQGSDVVLEVGSGRYTFVVAGR